MGKVLVSMKVFADEGVTLEELMSRVKLVDGCNTCKIVDYVFGTKVIQASFVTEDGSGRDFETEVSSLPGVSNVQVLVQQHRDQLVFLHQVAPGAADKSWGVHVARLAGVPIDVIERARDLLIGFEAEASAPAKPRRKATQQDQLSLFE